MDNKEEDVLGEFVANGKEYLEEPDESAYKEISDSSIIGALTNNGTYYFKNSSGKYVSSNNSKNNSVSNSYVKIDLSNQQGKYYVKVNAEVSSEARYDFGYATITKTTKAPTYNTTDGRFIYISGSVSAQDYDSMKLNGGSVYYLHLGYRKDSSGNTGSDTFTINSIKLYGATDGKKVSYNFVKNGEQYVSNNQGKASTIASSYVELDLTDKVGKYFVSVNAEVSSDTNDYGYAFVTSDTTDPGPNLYYGRIMKISGVKEAADYTYTDALVGGKIHQEIQEMINLLLIV